MYVGVGPKSTLASILQFLQKTLQLSVVSSATALLVERRQLLRMEPCTFPATRCHAFSTVESHAERSGAGKVGRADGGQQALSSQTLITNTLPCCQFQRRQSPGSMGSSGRHHHPSAAHPATRSREVWPRSTIDNTVKAGVAVQGRGDCLQRSPVVRGGRRKRTGKGLVGMRKARGVDACFLCSDFPGSVRLGLALSSLPCLGWVGHGVGWQFPTLVLEMLQREDSNMLFWPA
ncbi:hypothetical protein FJTKL_13381 [Diaporthe vaccinii]|uniref:Uncharacterized protein n=2 Tax=Diaporthe vaccinii TaxID=105482 RepID=A0ABR4EAU4_9PEZI